MCAKPMLVVTVFYEIDNTRATQVNRIVTHATMPLLISGHEDRHIKVFDTRTGMDHSIRMVMRNLILP
jgi:striatin 1/3/4